MRRRYYVDRIPLPEEDYADQDSGRLASAAWLVVVCAALCLALMLLW